jgi:hypothetical protein
MANEKKSEAFQAYELQEKALFEQVISGKIKPKEWLDRAQAAILEHVAGFTQDEYCAIQNMLLNKHAVFAEEFSRRGGLLGLGNETGQ